MRVSGAIATAAAPRRTLKQAREEHCRRLAAIVAKQWRNFVAERKRRRIRQLSKKGEMAPFAITVLRKWLEVAGREASLIDLGAAALHLRAKRLFAQCLEAWHAAAVAQHYFRRRLLSRYGRSSTNEARLGLLARV